MLAAAILRFWSVNFGLPAINDPDELIFELGAMKLLFGKTLNPGWFGHPATTTLYILALLHIGIYGVGNALGWFPSIKAFGAAIYQNPGVVILPARVVMVLFGIWCVYLTYRLGRELFGRQAGLLAALLLALDPVHIAYSLVVRSDIMATAFMLLMLLATLRFAREGRWRDVAMAAIWLGLATTSKWPFAACGISFAAVGLYRMAAKSGRFQTEMVRMVAFGIVSIVAVIAISPYLLLDHTAALKSVQGESQIRHVAATGHGFLWNAGWYLRQPLAQALGWFGILLSAAGIAMAARHREARVLLFPLMAVLTLVTLTQNLIWIRWTLPLLPFLSMFAAIAFLALSAWIDRHIKGGAGRAVAIAALALLIAPLLWQTHRDAAERMNDTRQAATAWAAQHIPASADVLVEHFGFDLLRYPWGFYFPLADAGCVDARAFLQGKVKYSTIEALRGGHHNVDMGTITQKARGNCAMTYAIISQYDRYKADEALFPVEMANYRDLLSRSTLLQTIAPKSGEMGGPIIRIIRIDRPYGMRGDPVKTP